MKHAILALGVAIVMLSGAASAEIQKRQPSTAKAKPHPTKAQTPAADTTGKLSPVQQKLRTNPDLASRVAERLPPRIDIDWAASGFKNLGQFVAAVNAADNLDIPFMTLKSRLLDDGMSLGEAIRDLRRSSDYRKEARRAENEANAMMRGR